MSSQDQRLKQAIRATIGILTATLAPFVNLSDQKLSEEIEGALLELLDTLGVDTGGVKTSSKQLEIDIE